MCIYIYICLIIPWHEYMGALAGRGRGRGTEREGARSYAFKILEGGQREREREIVVLLKEARVRVVLCCH